MSRVERPDAGDAYVEVQLDRETVVLVVAAVLLLLAGAFLLGRWTARPAAGEASDVAAITAAEGEPAVAAEEPEIEEVDGTPPFGAEPLAPVPARLPGISAVAPGPPATSRTASEPRPVTSPAPARPAPRAAPAPPTTAPGSWVVQVAAVDDAAQAGAMRRRLAAAGYPATVVREDAHHKVHVGPFATRAAADVAAGKLAREEGLQTWVRTAKAAP